MINVLIFNEFVAEKHNPNVQKVYPKGIHAVIAEAIKSDDLSVKTVTLDDPDCGITEELLDQTDVLIWWGHAAHHLVPDNIANMVSQAVLKGMGFIALHSAHISKPLTRILGTSCTLKWRDNDRERLWVTSPTHPIAEGLPEHFELPHEEMYGENFDIPRPDDIVFMGWFAGGELFRSGCTFTRGYGKIFYFQPGHEEYPIYYDANIRKVLCNAVRWAVPTKRRNTLNCPNPQPLEK